MTAAVLAPVQSGRVADFIGNGEAGFGATKTTNASQIAASVAAHFTAETIGGVPVDDLTAASTGGP